LLLRRQRSGGLQLKGNPGSCETLSQKNPSQKKGPVEWLKVRPSEFKPQYREKKLKKKRKTTFPPNI
jgi:hypothetical protein